MAFPDICLSCGDNYTAGAAIGQPDNMGGGIGATGVVTGDGVRYGGVIGSTPCRRPVLAAVSGVKRVFNIQLTRTDGTPLNLTGLTCKFRVKETEDAAQYYIDKDMGILDAATGMTQLVLTKSNLAYAGVWLAAVQVLEGEDVIIQYEIYLYVEKGLHSSERTNVPISMADVRMALLDCCPADNSLLDDVEFGDAEIVHAIRMPVDEWNETPPLISGYQYTPATFPYRYNWTQATAAELLRMASRRLFRNKLDYSAGGLQVQDRARAPIYDQIAERMRKEWKEWILREKRRINAELCYKTLTAHIYY
jgi:hypothetical protein